jgi:hypothetical protein
VAPKFDRPTLGDRIAPYLVAALFVAALAFAIYSALT